MLLLLSLVGPRYDAISWYVAGNRQSLLHVQNISEEEVQAQVTLRYYEGQGSYKLPLLAVPPQATRTVNLKEAIAAAQPDADGNLIPPTTTFGTATVEVADGRLAPRLLASGAQYYPALALGGGTFFPCIGVESVELFANPTAGLVGGFDFLTAEADWSDGANTDVTQDASFGTVDPVIATVQDGGADHGKVDFLSAGETDAVSFTFVPVLNPEDPLFCAFLALLARALIDSANPPPTLASFQITVISTPVTGETNSVVSGQSAQVKVEAIDNTGVVFTGYQGTVRFSSGDTTATLPSDYTFTTTDAGSHTFNVTLKTVSGTSATRDLAVRDLATSISNTKNISVWFQSSMDAEFWKNCGFVQCPDLGSYFCQTAYDPDGFSQKTAFVALTHSSSTLANKPVTVRNGASKAVTFVGDMQDLFSISRTGTLVLHHLQQVAV